ncbi:type I-F CRISPR-associated endoribonuclease Cas6/Csy4 [Pseudomonas asuensis]|uniref:type I-F CRISPR-associated endoribonuclease Cas6/Csy4 n=1 Tax=Pseudomonas asuensis TaxID=1825787 RepID=UPI001665407C|nr:type I-F CRISPR-associated endoribonuclease Cas6/Csy4 [Pseudomonas asuensis]
MPAEPSHGFDPDGRANDGAVSGFPRARNGAVGLGDFLRLHGGQAALNDLLVVPWLTGMRDHVRLSAVAAVPSNTKHSQVRRVQVDSSSERLRRRAMKRHGLTEEQARERIPDSVEKKLRLPYLQLRSQRVVCG